MIDDPMENYKKLKEKQIVNFIFSILYIIPLVGILFIQIFWVYNISIFQTGLLIIYGLLTGLFLNLTFGFKYPLYMDKRKIGHGAYRIFNQRINIITISFISLIFIGIYAYNISNIIFFGCPTINNPGGIKDIELLNYEEEKYYIHEIGNDNHEDNKKRELNILQNSKVHNFVLFRLCNNEQVLYFFILFFLLYLILLHIVTIYSYGRNIIYWIDESLKYNHFIFLILHFIPFMIILILQIFLVYQVSVIQSGLLIPFGFVNGIFVSILRDGRESDINRLTKEKTFKITARNRIYIIISSIFSLIFILFFLYNLSKTYSECSNQLPMPIKPPITNKMFTDFMVIEMCGPEYAISITILIFIYYLLILNFVTFIVYTIYFSIKNLNSSLF